MSKKVFACLLLLALLIACGGAALAQDTTLTMLTHWGTEDQLAAQQAIIDAYMAENPDVAVELVTVDFGELRTKIITGSYGRHQRRCLPLLSPLAARFRERWRAGRAAAGCADLYQ